ncbi:SpaH/EbpB family LPXTG-anchored major pilin [Acidipropionibacterium jensenii]|uniref:SpaH/EbpB family LPXTG-anchored major pilin n=1 Tax=Acidipropionibacterium jensenii TaxID=1749 RepID=UPI00214C10EB|nr:SpaH/EbpB family LPXTG-anchored major pilin [Acidipropionibacterium jensenii]
MNTHKGLTSWRRRVVAAAGAVALASSMMFAGVANAAGPSSIQPTDPDAPQTGSLTIHKISGSETHNNTNDGTEQSVSGTPLPGVTFSVTPVVSKDGAMIDLTTAAGWNLITNATATSVQSAPYALGTSVEKPTRDDGTAAFSGLELGLYLVKETSQGSNSIVTSTAPFLVTIPLNQKNANGTATNQWLYDVHAYPKNQVITEPTKTVGYPSTNLAGRLPWTITQPLPALNTTDTLTSLTITDKIDSRLVYAADDPATVTVASVTLTAGTDYTLTAPSDSNSNTLSVVFTAAGLAKLPKTSGNVVVSFKTDVKEAGTYTNTAVTNVNGHEFTSAPQTSQWGGITITKQDASTKEKLDGAEFSIYNDLNGVKDDKALANGTTKGGALSFGPLWVSNNSSQASRDYWIVETKAPTGYVLDPTPIKVTVTPATEETYKEVTVDNSKPLIPGLPLTGGQGTKAISGIGLLLLAAGAGVGVVSARRRKQDA